MFLFFYVDIDYGIHKGKSKVPQNEKQKKTSWDILYIKFWSIWLEQFVEHNQLISKSVYIKPGQGNQAILGDLTKKAFTISHKKFKHFSYFSARGHWSSSVISCSFLPYFFLAFFLILKFLLIAPIMKTNNDIFTKNTPIFIFYPQWVL